MKQLSHCDENSSPQSRSLLSESAVERISWNETRITSFVPEAVELLCELWHTEEPDDEGGCGKRKEQKVQVMGLFDWILRPSPSSTPKKCSSAYSACWAQDGSSEEEEDNPEFELPDPPSSPIVRELGRQHSNQYLSVDESKTDPNPYLHRRARFSARNLPVVPPPPPTKHQHSSPLRQPFEDSEDHKLSSHRGVTEDGISLQFRQVIEDRRPLQRNRVAGTGRVSPPRELAKKRKPSPCRRTVEDPEPRPHQQDFVTQKPPPALKHRHPSPPARTTDRKLLKVDSSSRPISAPPRLGLGRKRSPPREVAAQDQPSGHKRAKHTRSSPREVEEVSLALSPHPDSGSSENAVPLILPIPSNKSRHLKSRSPPPRTHHRKSRDTALGSFFPTPHLSPVDGFCTKALKTVACHQPESKPLMGRRGQRHDEEYHEDYQGYWDKNGSGGRKSLAIEIKREAAQDLAAQEAEEEEQRRMIESPRSPRSVSGSCADSYCSHSEHPLRRKKCDSKFPYGTPQNRPISPPGWTYAPKRKTKRGDWWDKDWPQNKKYLFYDSNLQPCGCPWTKRHAGSRSPSPPVGVRARGLAYADKIVKINREKSLSPRPRSQRKLVTTNEDRAGGAHRHRHVHMQWSCSNSSRNSSRPGSRARTPVSTRVVINDPQTSYGSESPNSHHRRAPRVESQYEDQDSSLIEEEPALHQYPNNGVGFCTSLSQSTIPWSTQQPRKSGSKDRTSPPRAKSQRRVVRTGVSAPLRQRPGNSQNLRVCVASSSGGSTPCSISMERNFFHYDQMDDDLPIDDRTGVQGRRPREKYVGTMGHCHTPNSWSCTPVSNPTTPRKLTPTTPRASTPGRPIPSRKPEYRVTITCPPDQNLIDDPSESTESDESCNCSQNCPCRNNSFVNQGCCRDDVCPAIRNRAIGGPCDWNNVVHHHFHQNHCFCGCCSHC
ncbi:hypothetical protein R1sor_027438 [Riccia sorocarpa]|uniref:Uncharacterized protein n=1 Tax=Riccia sorocarpa TaxID=122646 RepID=A0ABD3GE77_9MARC